MESQIKFTFVVGLQHSKPHFPMWSRHESFKRAVVRDACDMIGGCSTREDHGYWVPGAEIIQDRYNGSEVPEEAWTIEMCVSLADYDSVYRRMKSSIVDAACRFDVETNWVHVTSEAVFTKHFSIDKERQK